MCHPFQTSSSHALDACETYPCGIVPNMDNLGLTDRTWIYDKPVGSEENFGGITSMFYAAPYLACSWRTARLLGVCFIAEDPKERNTFGRSSQK
jgi:hypothetical protein